MSTAIGCARLCYHGLVCPKTVCTMRLRSFSASVSGTESSTNTHFRLANDKKTRRRTSQRMSSARQLEATTTQLRETTTASLPYQRGEFNKVKSVLGISKPEDWYTVTSTAVCAAGGSTILTAHYGGSLPRALKCIYPEHEFNEWRFVAAPRGWWNDIHNQRRYISWLEQEIGIKSLDDWYQMPTKVLLRNHATSLLKRYRGSPARLLRTIYPDHDWIPWRFPAVAKGFWAYFDNHKAYFDWLLRDLGLSHTLEDFGKVTVDQIKERGGGKLLHMYYGGSVASAFRQIYPSLHKPQTVLLDLDDQRKVLESMKGTLGISKLDDWYNTTNRAMIRAGGAILLQNHNGSLINVMRSVYPDHDWKEWKFKYAPPGWWGNVLNQQQYVSWIEKQVGINSLEDWYSTGPAPIESNGGKTLLRTFYKGSLHRLLKAVYPHHEWIPWKFNRVESGFWDKKSNQKSFIEWVLRDLGLSNRVQDVVKLTRAQVIARGGRNLLETYYENSLSRALDELYPEARESLATSNKIPLRDRYSFE